MKKNTYIILMFILFTGGACLAQNNSPLNSAASKTWRFAVLGDTHIYSSDTVKEMIPYILKDSVDCVLVCGDLVEGGLNCSADQLKAELNDWISVFSPLYQSGIGIYPVRGNHEADARNNITVWNSVFSGQYALPAGGPAGEENLTFSFKHKNALFIGMDDYVRIHTVNESWLKARLDSNTLPHVFVFGHEPAFKVFHSDCLDDSVTARNNFWNSLAAGNVKVYFCGHDHFLDASLIDDGDGKSSNDIYQYLVGTGGGWLMQQYSNYNGNNSSFSPSRLFHKMEHGYAVVEISGDGNNDLDVLITWKERTFNSSLSAYEYTASPYIIRYSANGNTLTKAEKNDSGIPRDFTLGQNYPNPFNPSTIINYSIPDGNGKNEGSGRHVALKVYDILGREISTLYEGEKTPGTYSANFDGAELPSGVYIYSLQSNASTLSKKMILMK